MCVVGRFTFSSHGAKHLTSKGLGDGSLNYVFFTRQFQASWVVGKRYTSWGCVNLPIGGSAAWAATEATRAATARTLRTLLISKGIVFLISGSWKREVGGISREELEIWEGGTLFVSFVWI